MSEITAARKKELRQWAEIHGGRNLLEVLDALEASEQRAERAEQLLRHVLEFFDANMDADVLLDTGQIRSFLLSDTAAESHTASDSAEVEDA